MTVMINWAKHTTFKFKILVLSVLFILILIKKVNYISGVHIITSNLIIFFEC